MVQVFVVNPKGGCGKTTIAAQIASFFIAHQRTVVLVDHDNQKSCSDWLHGRPRKCPPITLVQAHDHLSLPALPTADIIVHDMPAAWTTAKAPGLIRPGDKMIIPVLPSPTDIKACLRFVMSLYRAGLIGTGIDIGLVANRIRKNTQYYQVLADFLQRIDLPLLGTLRDSQNYVNAMNRGVSIFDLPQARAAQDRAQWQPILDWIWPPVSSYSEVVIA